MSRRSPVVGLYVHIPFCERLCPYCDFAVAVRSQPDHRGYLEALAREFEHRSHELEGRHVQTIYIGGGTPSLWDPACLVDLSERLREAVDLSSVIEFSLEANPTSVTAQNIQAWRQAGVTRISLGVQSFSDRYLGALGRNHDSSRAHVALEALLEAGFDVSMDLIVGGPGNELAELKTDLEQVERYSDLTHVSVYQLTLERRTVYWRRYQAGELELPRDDDSADLLEYAEEALESMGFEHYEVSSYAREGARSIHNQNYWTGGEYFGMGTGAHSFRRSEGGWVRRANPRALKTYVESPEVAEQNEDIGALEHLAERLFLGVRSLAGVSVESLREEFSPPVPGAYWRRLRSKLDEFVDHGLLRLEGGRYVPSRRGLFLNDTLAETLFLLEP